MSEVKAGVMRRVIHAKTTIVDGEKGIVTYTASDETVDSYQEVIKADGWRFHAFQKNAPFVDSHDYSSVMKLLGKVIDYQVKGKELVETVQWAIDVPNNGLARLGWEMTKAGYLRAVSVGFEPVTMVSRWDRDLGPWKEECVKLGADPESPEAPRVIYLEQEQRELSACVVGANANAVARMAKGLLSASEFNILAGRIAGTETGRAAVAPSGVAQPPRWARSKFLTAVVCALRR